MPSPELAVADLPAWDGRIRALIEVARARLPDALQHVDASRILIVAGAARSSTKASMRPLTFGGDPLVFRSRDGRYEKPPIIVGQQTMLYELCLRPSFFRLCTPRERVGLILHELWHVSLRFDGTLEPSRRHRASTSFEAEVSRLVERMFEYEPNVEADLSGPGWVRVPAWLRRPPSLIPVGRPVRAFGTGDLFDAAIAVL